MTGKRKSLSQHLVFFHFHLLWDKNKIIPLILTIIHQWLVPQHWIWFGCIRSVYHYPHNLHWWYIMSISLYSSNAKAFICFTNHIICRGNHLFDSCHITCFISNKYLLQYVYIGHQFGGWNNSSHMSSCCSFFPSLLLHTHKFFIFAVCLFVFLYSSAQLLSCLPFLYLLYLFFF